MKLPCLNLLRAGSTQFTSSQRVVLRPFYCYSLIFVLISQVIYKFEDRRFRRFDSKILRGILECGRAQVIQIYIVKGKAIPLQAWTVLECIRRLRLPDFKTVGT